PIDIELVQQDDLPTGKFRVVSETLGTPQRRPAQYQQPEPQPYEQEPYVPPNPPPVVPQYQQPPPQQPAARRGHPQVMLEVNGRRRPVNPPGVVLGRGTDADIQINDPGVSRRHAEIRLMPEGPGGIRVVLVDLGSTNGTLVNGRRSTEAELTDGSTVRIGNTTMTLRLADEPMAQPPSSGW
ncbi:MAG TPA: FHA domain-containing protein, partial [Kribbella sp.]|nr:FHA domain-containing protein [Kribbella sp.]